MSTTVNSAGDDISADRNFALRTVKRVIYVTIEIISKANVRLKGDKFMKLSMKMLLMMMLLATMTMFI